MKLAYQAAAVPAGSALHSFFVTASYPLRVILRRNMGERQAALVRMMSGTTMALLYFALMLIPGTLTAMALNPMVTMSLRDSGLDASRLQILFFLFRCLLNVMFLSFAWFCFFRRHREVMQRIETDTRWHSHYIGDSLLWELVGRKLWRQPAGQHAHDGFMILVEPACIALVGLLLLITIAPALGLYLFLSAFALSIDYAAMIDARRNRYLDAVDAAIEGDNLRKALVEKQPPIMTEGFTVPEDLPMTNTREARETLAELMERLDPRMRDLMDPLPEGYGNFPRGATNEPATIDPQPAPVITTPA